ncbi:MAG: SNF2-related protein [Rikenellaceae bacterium]
MEKITLYHAKYYAHSLTLKHPSHSLQKLTAVLGDARVDLNPHQVEAALFAFNSPLKKGAILADEVGLGKTIEAGLVIAQKWAEKCRHIIVICPANLRKQWQMELEEKFFLQSTIVENIDFKTNPNAFRTSEKIIICSYQLAYKRAEELGSTVWDLAVIDEAHRLRNVYRPDNKIGNAIKDALKATPKILLTATPLQNSLSELYGLVSLIDNYAFGDYSSYKAQYSRLDTEQSFSSLKGRLSNICHRTLRRQVQEYINYTKRIALVEEFVPHKEEMELYDMVSAYLYRNRLYALPNSQRHLITLILRKLLASSSFAVQGTFIKLTEKLEATLQDLSKKIDLQEELDTFSEFVEEWDEEDASKYGIDDREAIEEEIKELKRFTALAQSIKSNSKGERLITALDRGFAKLQELGAPRKAIIFTESRRTQDYIKDILTKAGYKGKVVLFNGTNSDKESKTIYEQWLQLNTDTDKISGSKTADMRQALTDYFRNEADIMIATEAAAEGINLQFCSLVVNYDLPWNPQRVEQRIGRCHRYGQKFDVVVLNFLNKTNEADQRVYKLLDEKFQLFSGVFGVSDEVLGKIEEGVDFEKRIGAIFQSCRTSEQIKVAFDELQAEYSEEIESTLKATKKKLLENFDAEVHEKLRMNLKKGREYLSKHEQWLWAITKDYIGFNGSFNDERLYFKVRNNIVGLTKGMYKLLRSGEHAPIPTERDIEIGKLNPQFMPTEYFDGYRHIYRTNHPFAQQIIKHYKDKPLAVVELVFTMPKDRIKRASIEPYIGKSGFMTLTKLTINSFEESEYLILSAVTNRYEPLDHEACHRLFDLPAKVGREIIISPEMLNDLHLATIMFKDKVIAQAEQYNAQYFSAEMDKLQEWADDMNVGLERELKELEFAIKVAKGDSKKSTNLQEKVTLQRKVKDLEAKRNTKRRGYFEAQDNIEQQKDALLTEIEKRLKQEISEEILFTIRWSLK